jgi:hypothetical protein
MCKHAYDYRLEAMGRAIWNLDEKNFQETFSAKIPRDKLRDQRLFLFQVITKFAMCIQHCPLPFTQ